MYSDQERVDINQSLRILSNLVAAEALNSGGRIDEIITELLAFSGAIIKVKTSEVNDMVEKV